MRGLPVRSRIIALVAAVAVMAVTAGALTWGATTSSQASAEYRQHRAALDAQLGQARQQGYTATDLAPITSRLAALDGGREPWWVPGRPGYYRDRAAEVARLQTQLPVLEARLYLQAQADATAQVGAARTQIAQNQQAGATTSDVQPLQQRLDAAARAQGAAHTVAEHRAAAQQAGAVAADATTLGRQLEQENQAVAQAAQQLVAQTGGNLTAIQQAGQQALAAGRNDASVAAYMERGGMIKGYPAVQRAYERLETFGGMIGAADVDQAARGAAGAQGFAGHVHDALIAGLPAKAVVVSFDAQHLWAYENGHVVLENAVTTGVRGVTDYGTDFGPMKVLRREHPWTMKSPWPKTSPYWYPDTVVQWATFFTRTGEAIHDAAWEPDSLLGPGSQYDASTRSHGCVHLPLDKSQWILGWAEVGTPVIVYPGDGSPVAKQLSLMTTNDKGVPNSAG